MLALKKYKISRKVLRSRAILVLLVLLLLFLGNGTWKIYQKAVIAEEQKARAEKDLADLQARAADLQAKIGDLKTDRGLEEEIRQRFNVVKDGESVVVVVDPSTQNGTSTKSAGSGISLWWHKLLGIFGGQ